MAAAFQLNAFEPTAFEVGDATGAFQSGAFEATAFYVGGGTM